MKEISEKKENSLILLKILMSQTDEFHRLTKIELIEKLSEVIGYEIEEKQFYRIIDKLKEANFSIETTKGKYSKYYYVGGRLSESDILYIMNTIIVQDDISNEDKIRIIDGINMKAFSKDVDDIEIYDEFEYKKLKLYENHNINYLVLDNFERIYKSYYEGLELVYKVYKDGIISEYKKGIVTEIVLKDKKTKVVINDNEYYINEIINTKF